MKSYIHFIRHGITEGIIKKWYYGSTDLPLVEEGVKALEELKSEGIYPALGSADCYTSGMTRANETFNVTYGDVPYKPITLLREMNFGRWECKTFDEIQQDEESKIWLADEEGSFFFPDGGDSILSFYERIREGLDELCSYHRLKEETVAADGSDAVSIMVCHGGTIAATMEYWFPGDRDNFWQWIPKTGRGFTIEFEDGKAMRYTEI